MIFAINSDLARSAIQKHHKNSDLTVPHTYKATNCTLILIGANTRLGFEAAKHFAKMNLARLVLTARVGKKGTEALTRIQQETGYRKAELWIIDLANLSNVAYKQLRSWMFAIRMIPKLFQTSRKRSVIPRLMIVASDVYYWTTIDNGVIAGLSMLENLSDKDNCTKEVMNHRYFDSKDRSHAEGGRAMLFSTEERSRQLVYGAVGLLDDEEKLRGKSIQMSEVVEKCNFVTSKDGKIVQDKVWGEMLDILGKIDPKVPDVAKAYLK
ncbi:hypothetical protein EDD18DRAFT_1313358 [Armillaria luteobubalina]|uniref:NAD(P)-binding protein n=1 Tax=Armillaria luteobubalina TaxID=153913 RepID=A0AA39U5X3_9AGAR|nr:hypothetical protein EDD18DRAFT_1313358 [Armillaria luteobubalina]